MPTEYPMQEPTGELAPAPQEPEPTPVEGPVLEQPVEEEVVPYRVGDQEVPLPLSAVQAIAERLGYDNAAAVLNQLRNGAEAQEIYKQARTVYQQARRAAAEHTAPGPQVEQRWQQHLQHQAPPRPPSDEIDPIALVSEMRDEIRAMRREQAEMKQHEYDQQLTRLDREATVEYQRFVSELKKNNVPEWKIPDRNYLLGEAEMLGMYHSDMPISEMYRSVWKLANADYIAQSAATNAVQSHVDKLSQRGAKVVVPVSRPAPPPVGSANDIDNMKLRDVLPEGKY